jgi:spore germination cell wall hydrolase CwlJ-like protein
MAKTIFGEARGEYRRMNGDTRPLVAVGSVIMNRHAKSGKPVGRVCLQPRQFSCWNPGDPNKKAIDGVSLDDEVYRVCLVVADKIIGKKIGDITGGANHYYSKTMPAPPYWAVGKAPVFEIGRHLFFRM